MRANKRSRRCRRRRTGCAWLAWMRTIRWRARHGDPSPSPAPRATGASRWPKHRRATPSSSSPRCGKEPRRARQPPPPRSPPSSPPSPPPSRGSSTSDGRVTPARRRRRTREVAPPLLTRTPRRVSWGTCATCCPGTGISGRARRSSCPRRRKPPRKSPRGANRRARVQPGRVQSRRRGLPRGDGGRSSACYPTARTFTG